MNLYIGIDLGTSAAKLLLMDANGQVLNIVSKEYPLEFPQPGWSQQNPEDWRRAVTEGIPELLRGFDGGAVAGIGCGGAMLAMVACGEYESVQAVCDRFVRVASRVKPEPELADRYEERYRKFREIYPACRGLFRTLCGE